MIDTVIIHCSASPQGRGDDAAMIHSWHKQRMFDGIGYHYVILENGAVQAGRPEYWAGAHAKGHNDAIGICLIGMGGDATDAQLRALAQLVIGLNHKYDGVEVLGHCDVDPEGKPDCPGFDVKQWWQTIA